MRKMKSLQKSAALLLSVSISALVFLSGCSSSPVNKKVFSIALECAYAPYNWTQTDNSNGAVPIYDSNTFCNGYDIQIAKKIAAGMGRTLEVHKTKWTAIPVAILSEKLTPVSAA